MDDIVINKAAAIERCAQRVREEHAGDDSVLERDLTKQDSIVLNLQRACETSIDLAMHLVRVANLGIPQDSRDAFSLLATHSGLDQSLAERLMRMVGFRNVAVHDYQKLNLDVVRDVIAKRLPDLLEFTRWAVVTKGG